MPVAASPGAGGAKPKIPCCHARSAAPSSVNAITSDAADLTDPLAPSSAVHAVGFAAKSEISAWLARCACRAFHSDAIVAARSGSADLTAAIYVPSTPELEQGERPAGMSVAWSTVCATIAWIAATGVGEGVATAAGWH